jgi:mRNA-degrading endonuclease RelE of RelBE toxin-antitoxin system
MTKFDVHFSSRFIHDLKRLARKYRHVWHDINTIIEQLTNGETPGDQIPGVGYPVYKVRVNSSDMQRGKSGSYRVLYYLWTTNRRLLLVIYAKSSQENINPGIIRRIIEEESDSDDS